MHADFAAVGRALAAPARALMVSVLLDGRSHTAGELAHAAGVASGTAAGHLAVLVDSGMVTVRREGRFRRYEIADERTATALEALSRRVDTAVTSLRLSLEQRRVRAARTCYDHLAGELGVGLARGLVARGWLGEGMNDIRPAGADGLRGLGIDVEALRRARRAFIRPCLDWTEREHHIGGAVGAALATTALERGWVVRVENSRALRITRTGSDAFSRLSGVASRESSR